MDQEGSSNRRRQSLNRCHSITGMANQRLSDRKRMGINNQSFNANHDRHHAYDTIQSQPIPSNIGNLNINGFNTINCRLNQTRANNN